MYMSMERDHLANRVELPDSGESKCKEIAKAQAEDVSDCGRKGGRDAIPLKVRWTRPDSSIITHARNSGEWFNRYLDFGLVSAALGRRPITRDKLTGIHIEYSRCEHSARVTSVFGRDQSLLMGLPSQIRPINIIISY